MPRNDTAEAAFDAGVAHHRAGRFVEAERIYHEVLEAKPDHAGALNLLGTIRHQSGDMTRAVELIGRAIAIAPDYPQAHNNLGNTLKDLGEIGEAIAAYRRALEIAPDYALAHNNLAIALTEYGKVEDAIACYRRALEIAPDYAMAHYNLGNAFRDLGQADEAIARYEQAIAIMPGLAQAHHNLGVVLAEQGRSDEAVALYGRAIEIDPDYTEAHYNLGNLYWVQERTDAALACYRRAIALQPDLAQAHLALGRAQQGAGDADAAIACFRRAHDIDPDCARVSYTLATALQECGRLDEAIAAYERTIISQADHLAAHFGLSAILNTTDRRVAARRTLEDGVRHQPVMTTECTAKRGPLATILKLVGLQGTYLIDKDGESTITGAFLDTGKLIDTDKFTVHRYHIFDDNLLEARIDLPQYDIVLNGIVEPDVEPKSLEVAWEFIRQQEAPFLNDPRKIIQTSRDGIYRLLTDIDHLVVPKTVRMKLVDRNPADLLPVMERHGLTFPILVRPIGYHYGGGLVKINREQDLKNVIIPEQTNTMYVTQFYDIRGAEEYFHKIRMYFIDGKIHMNHKYILDHWNIHGLESESFIFENEWARKIEAEFFEDHVGHLGEKNNFALNEIFRRIGLDFCGIDFAVLPDGRILLFECNPAMQYFRARADDERLVYLRKHVYEVTDAFSEMILSRTRY